MINKFKKFSGEKIPNIIEYIKEFLINNPKATISVGCDSVQKGKKVVYAIIIMFNNNDVRRGAHLLYYKEYFQKDMSREDRLAKEAVYVYELGTFLDDNLSDFYQRSDLSEVECKRYKYHLLRCNGEYNFIRPYQEPSFIKNLHLTEVERGGFRLVDLHVDFNPFDGVKVKSYQAYKNYVPWLRGMGFRTWAKNQAFAASSAADVLLKN
jgi:predicted RNase H-related nuclease YkuK (DUF458 family)